MSSSCIENGLNCDPGVIILGLCAATLGFVCLMLVILAASEIKNCTKHSTPKQVSKE